MKVKKERKYPKTLSFIKMLSQTFKDNFFTNPIDWLLSANRLVSVTCVLNCLDSFCFNQNDSKIFLGIFSKEIEAWKLFFVCVWFSGITLRKNPLCSYKLPFTQTWQNELSHFLTFTLWSFKTCQVNLSYRTLLKSSWRRGLKYNKVKYHHPRIFAVIIKPLTCPLACDIWIRCYIGCIIKH